MAKKKSSKKIVKTTASCQCPYCETKIMMTHFPFCQKCGLEIHRCVSCLVVLPKDAKTCPSCGTTIK